MLIINGKKYAASKKEFAASLFTSQTCSGFYKKVKNGVRLSDHQGEVFAFIFNNGRFDRGLVSCRKHGNGFRYMFYTMTIDEKKLGYENGLRYSESVRIADQVVESLFPEQCLPIAL